MRRVLLSWIDSNEFPWSPPRWWNGTENEGDIRRLRELARGCLREKLIASQGWGKTLVQAFVWPVWALIKAWRHVRGSYSLHGCGRSRPIFWLDVCWLQLAYNIRVSDQVDLRLDLPQHRRRVRSMLVCREQQVLLGMAKGVRRGPDEIGEKREFARFCRMHGISSAVVLHDSDAKIGSESERAPWPARDLFFKPSNMAKGLGAEVFRYRPDADTWFAQGGELITPDTISKYAAEKLGPGAPWVLQPRLTNHPSWLLFPTDVLCTCRIVTARVGPRDEDVSLLGCYYRCPSTSALVDNLCSGGIGVEVDITTGALGYAVNFTDLGAPLIRHPVSGAPFPGLVLGHWAECTRLAIEAHRSAGAWCSVGWDVSCMTEGPILIEANIQWASSAFLMTEGNRIPAVMKYAFGDRYERFGTE